MPVVGGPDTLISPPEVLVSEKNETRVVRGLEILEEGGQGVLRRI